MAKNPTKSRQNGPGLWYSGFEMRYIFVVVCLVHLKWRLWCWSRPPDPVSCLPAGAWKNVGHLYWGCALYMKEHWLFSLFNSCTSLNTPNCRTEELTNGPEASSSSSSKLTSHAFSAFRSVGMGTERVMTNFLKVRFSSSLSLKTNPSLHITFHVMFNLFPAALKRFYFLNCISDKQSMYEMPHWRRRLFVFFQRME